ncbi:MAG: glutamate--tRNA ligase, partial [Spirulinaceae cyanobacterium]
RYDNRHRNLTTEEKAAFEAEGRRPVIRFKIDDDQKIVWQDQIRDQVTWRGSDLGGDMVIARTSDQADFGQPLYNLAVVVDDVDMGITHVIRGEDHIANTAKQILLYEAIGAEVPEFAHTPLILNPEGKKLSKRDGVTSIDDFKKMGFLPEALANYMTLLGWTPPDATEEIFTISQAAETFSLDRVNKAGAKFDWDKLDWLNSQYLHQIPGEELVDLLIPYWQAAGYEFDADKERSWLVQLATLIAPSLTRLTDAAEESRQIFNPAFSLKEEAIAQLQKEGATEAVKAIKTALEASKEELTEADAKQLIKQVTKEQKIKKGLLMRSLRAALLGELQGPDLMQSWLLLNQKGLDKERLSMMSTTTAKPNNDA